MTLKSCSDVALGQRRLPGYLERQSASVSCRSCKSILIFCMTLSLDITSSISGTDFILIVFKFYTGTFQIELENFESTNFSNLSTELQLVPITCFFVQLFFLSHYHSEVINFNYYRLELLRKISDFHFFGLNKKYL